MKMTNEKRNFISDLCLLGFVYDGDSEEVEYDINENLKLSINSNTTYINTKVNNKNVDTKEFYKELEYQLSGKEFNRYCSLLNEVYDIVINYNSLMIDILNNK